MVMVCAVRLGVSVAAILYLPCHGVTSLRIQRGIQWSAAKHHTYLVPNTPWRAAHQRMCGENVHTVMHGWGVRIWVYRAYRIIFSNRKLPYSMRLWKTVRSYYPEPVSYVHVEPSRDRNIPSNMWLERRIPRLPILAEPASSLNSTTYVVVS